MRQLRQPRLSVVLAMIAALAPCASCAEWLRQREIECRADKSLRCQQYINGGHRQEAEVVTHLELPDGDGYLVCCGHPRHRHECVQYFCPKGTDASECEKY